MVFGFATNGYIDYGFGDFWIYVANIDGGCETFLLKKKNERYSGTKNLSLYWGGSANSKCSS